MEWRKGKSTGIYRTEHLDPPEGLDDQGKARWLCDNLQPRSLRILLSAAEQLADKVLRFETDLDALTARLTPRRAVLVGVFWARCEVRFAEAFAAYGREDLARLRKAGHVDGANKKKLRALERFDAIRNVHRTRSEAIETVASALEFTVRATRNYLEGHYAPGESKKHGKRIL